MGPLAGIGDTGATHASGAARAIFAVSGAIAPPAALADFTDHPGAGIPQTRAGTADLAGRTPDIGAAHHTLAVSTEAPAAVVVATTDHVLAGIPQTASVETEPPGRARAGLADAGHTIAADTALVAGTLHALAGVDARAVLAPLGGAARDVVARTEAQTLATGLSVTAIGVGLAERPAGSIETEQLTTTAPIQVHHAVTVVVDPVADLHRIGPAATAGVPQRLVDASVAVVVDAVAHLLPRDGHRLTKERALGTDGFPLPARVRPARIASRAAAGVALVDIAVAIVVQTVAPLV